MAVVIQIVCLSVTQALCGALKKIQVVRAGMRSVINHSAVCDGVIVRCVLCVVRELRAQRGRR